MTYEQRPIKLDNPRAWRTYLGGKALSALHNDAGEDGHFPEEWIISTVAARNAGREDVAGEGMSHLFNTGETLKAWLERNAVGALGALHVAAHGAQPGVLVKLIDAAERLTIQVHPDRDQANKLFQSAYGKTECWHILGGRELAAESPCIYLGFTQDTTEAKWRNLFAAQDIPGMLACLHRFPVKVGDTILIEGGVPHAIGAGCFLAEIQEPTDYTIRVERTTPSGLSVADGMCHQGLGFERMFQCFHYEPQSRAQIAARYFVKPRLLVSEEGGQVTALIGYGHTQMFAMNRVQVWDTLTLSCKPQFSGLYILSGEGEMTCAGETMRIRQAEQYFMPAGIDRISFLAAHGTPLVMLQCFSPQCMDA